MVPVGWSSVHKRAGSEMEDRKRADDISIVGKEGLRDGQRLPWSLSDLGPRQVMIGLWSGGGNVNWDGCTK